MHNSTCFLRVRRKDRSLACTFVHVFLYFKHPNLSCFACYIPTIPIQIKTVIFGCFARKSSSALHTVQTFQRLPAMTGFYLFAKCICTTDDGHNFKIQENSICTTHVYVFVGVQKGIAGAFFSTGIIISHAVVLPKPVQLLQGDITTSSTYIVHIATCLASRIKNDFRAIDNCSDGLS
jgi:fucose 4-O-acetylase-like acetyltransferase